jgi:hypothetical protein
MALEACQDLTEKETAFVDAIIDDGMTNADAYAKAQGRARRPSDVTAACRLLAKPRVRAYWLGRRDAKRGEVVPIVEPSEDVTIIEGGGKVECVKPISRNFIHQTVLSIALTADNEAVRLAALVHLAKWTGADIKEKSDDDDLGALVRRLIKPTPGLHGEHINHAALEAQEAMKSPA